MITDQQILAVMPGHPVTLAWLCERLPERVSRGRVSAVPGIRCVGARFALCSVQRQEYNSSIKSIREAG